MSDKNLALLLRLNSRSMIAEQTKREEEVFIQLNKNVHLSLEMILIIEESV